MPPVQPLLRPADQPGPAPQEARARGRARWGSGALLPRGRGGRACGCGLTPPVRPLSTVGQHTGVLTNHLGTSASSPTSESDNHALLDEKEDSYFSEIRNFIANSEMNPASTRTDKR